MIEFVKDNKKWIYIIVITVVLFIGASRLINSCSHSAVDSLINEIETENIKKLSMNDENDAEEVLKGIAKKNGDWSTYPLSYLYIMLRSTCSDASELLSDKILTYARFSVSLLMIVVLMEACLLCATSFHPIRAMYSLSS